MIDKSPPYPLQSDDVRRLHSEIIKHLTNALLFASLLNCEDAVESGSILATLKSDVAACILLIKEASPLKDVMPPFMPVFINSQQWARSTQHWDRSPDVRTLFAEFIASGLIDVNAPLPGNDFKSTAYKSGALPLEAAVTMGSLASFKVLLDSGACIDKVPSKVYSIYHDEDRSHVNIYAFIDLHGRNETESQIFLATLKEFVMRRQLNRVNAAESGSESDSRLNSISESDSHIPDSTPDSSIPRDSRRRLGVL